MPVRMLVCRMYPVARHGKYNYFHGNVRVAKKIRKRNLKSRAVNSFQHKASSIRCLHLGTYATESTYHLAPQAASSPSYLPSRFCNCRLWADSCTREVLRERSQGYSWGPQLDTFRAILKSIFSLTTWCRRSLWHQSKYLKGMCLMASVQSSMVKNLSILSATSSPWKWMCTRLLVCRMRARHLSSLQAWEECFINAGRLPSTEAKGSTYPVAK